MGDQDHPPRRRASDMPSSQRMRHLELLMSQRDDLPESGDNPTTDGGGYIPKDSSEAQRLILTEIYSLRADVGRVWRKINKIDVDMAVLKTKMLFIGAAAGFLAAWGRELFKGGGK